MTEATATRTNDSDTEAHLSEIAAPCDCSVWAVYAPDGRIAVMDPDKEMACAKAVVRNGGRYGWVGMAVKGWRCVEGTFAPNHRYTTNGQYITATGGQT